MQLGYALLFICLATATAADVIVAARTLRPGTVVQAQDIAIESGNVPGTFQTPAGLIGQETRVAIYPGRPIRTGDVGPPAMVDRNQIIALRYTRDGLVITTEGRALGRAGVGERLRVINLSSKTTLFGRVSETGEVIVE